MLIKQWDISHLIMHFSATSYCVYPILTACYRWCPDVVIICTVKTTIGTGGLNPVHASETHSLIHDHCDY